MADECYVGRIKYYADLCQPLQHVPPHRRHLVHLPNLARRAHEHAGKSHPPSTLRGGPPPTLQPLRRPRRKVDHSSRWLDSDADEPTTKPPRKSGDAALRRPPDGRAHEAGQPGHDALPEAHAAAEHPLPQRPCGACGTRRAGALVLGVAGEGRDLPNLGVCGETCQIWEGGELPNWGVCRQTEWEETLLKRPGVDVTGQACA